MTKHAFKDFEVEMEVENEEENEDLKKYDRDGTETLTKAVFKKYSNV